jgi:hypothetical protein
MIQKRNSASSLRTPGVPIFFFNRKAIISNAPPATNNVVQFDVSKNRVGRVSAINIEPIDGWAQTTTAFYRNARLTVDRVSYATTWRPYNVRDTAWKGLPHFEGTQ